MRFTLNETFVQGFSSYKGPREGGERKNRKEWETKLEAEIGMSRVCERRRLDLEEMEGVHRCIPRESLERLYLGHITLKALSHGS